MRRITIDDLQAAVWAWRAGRRLRRDVHRLSLDRVSVLPVPRLPDSAERGVKAVLRRSDFTCLVRALLLQAWHDAHGRQRDMIIGVTRPSQGFKAHAWLEGEPPCHDEGFNELTRRAPT